MFAKPIMDLMIRDRHIQNKNKKIDFKIRKCIR